MEIDLYQEFLDEIPVVVTLIHKCGLIEWCNQRWRIIAANESKLPVCTLGVEYSQLSAWFTMVDDHCSQHTRSWKRQLGHAVGNLTRFQGAPNEAS